MGEAIERLVQPSQQLPETAVASYPVRVHKEEQCTLQLAEVHTFIGISLFLHNVWEIMRCVDCV